MNKALESPDYNLIIHNSPFSEPQANDYYHWHVELMPKLTRTAGFEWGTGFYINPTSPEEAAQVLRNAARRPRVRSSCGLRPWLRTRPLLSVLRLVFGERE